MPEFPTRQSSHVLSQALRREEGKDRDGDREIWARLKANEQSAKALESKLEQLSGASWERLGAELEKLQIHMASLEQMGHSNSSWLQRLEREIESNDSKCGEAMTELEGVKTLIYSSTARERELPLMSEKLKAMELGMRTLDNWRERQSSELSELREGQSKLSGGSHFEQRIEESVWAIERGLEELRRDVTERGLRDFGPERVDVPVAQKGWEEALQGVIEMLETEMNKMTNAFSVAEGERESDKVHLTSQLRQLESAIRRVEESAESGSCQMNELDRKIELTRAMAAQEIQKRIGELGTAVENELGGLRSWVSMVEGIAKKAEGEAARGMEGVAALSEDVAKTTDDIAQMLQSLADQVGSLDPQLLPSQSGLWATSWSPCCPKNV